MKKSNLWILIVLFVLGFVGLFIEQSFCFTDNFCVENVTLGWVFMVVGWGGFAGILLYQHFNRP